jgi:hypothetical protein
MLRRKLVLKEGDLPGNPSASSRVEANGVAFSASTLDTLSSASLSARAA